MISFRIGKLRIFLEFGVECGQIISVALLKEEVVTERIAGIGLESVFKQIVIALLYLFLFCFVIGGVAELTVFGHELLLLRHEIDEGVVGR